MLRRLLQFDILSVASLILFSVYLVAVFFL